LKAACESVRMKSMSESRLSVVASPMPHRSASAAVAVPPRLSLYLQSSLGITSGKTVRSCHMALRLPPSSTPGYPGPPRCVDGPIVPSSAEPIVGSGTPGERRPGPGVRKCVSCPVPCLGDGASSSAVLCQSSATCRLIRPSYASRSSLSESFLPSVLPPLCR